MKKWPWIKVILFLFCFFAPFLAISGKSATFDEARHFYTGLSYLKGASFPSGIVSSFSPSLEALQAIPAIFLKVDFTKSVYSFYDYILLPRLITMFFSLILAFFIYRWAKELYGEKAGVLALALYSFSPVILGNAGLVTPDLPFTCCAFIWFYYFWRLQNRYSLKNMLLCGLFFGLTIIAKLTFLMLIFSYLLLGLVVFLRTAYPGKKVYLSRFLTASLAMIIIGWVILNASYRFNFYPHLLLPELYLKNIKFILEYTAKGWESFLMGQYSSKGWPYYYLIAFLIKTPIPILIFLVLAIYRSLKNKSAKETKEYFLWVPPIVIFLAASFQHCQVGIRHILLVYPFIYVFMAKIVMEIKTLRILFAGLIVWLVFSSLWIFPHSLAYFNELIGGPKNGYKYLVDSNLDWGQDLYGLKKYMDRNGINKIKLSYFGSVNPEYYAIDYEPIPISPSVGIFAISATNLQGVYFPDHARYCWLNKYQPVARIGYTIFIYNIKNL